jgi:hypothetical protein
MPFVATSPYPTVETVLNVARTAMADAGVDPVTGNIVGDVFTDDRPGTLVIIQSAYDEVQTELTNNGVETFAKQATVTGIPPVATVDPGAEVSLGFTGYFDGVQNQPGFTLPADLRLPLLLWQRQSGAMMSFREMHASKEGLPSRVKTSYSPEWDWRSDAVYMVGALLSLDIKFRYIPYLPKLTLAGGGAQQLLILNCENAVGYKAAALFSASVDGEAADKLDARANKYIEQMCIQTQRKLQRENFRRIPYSRRSSRGRR